MSPAFLAPFSTLCSRSAALSSASCVGAVYGVQYWRDQVRILASPNDAASAQLTPTATYSKISGSSATPQNGPLDSSFAGSTCTNALRALHLKLQYDRDLQTLTAAAWEFVVEDISAVPVQQAFQVSY